MHKSKNKIIALLVIGCILLNIAGRELAVALDLPVWLDSLGTVAVACAFGPVCGAIVGAASNIIRGLLEPGSTMAYAFVGATIGAVVGVCAKRKMFKTVYGALSADFITALDSTLISTPLNMWVSGGYTGNTWGDGVIDMLLEYGVGKWISCAVGQFYVDFVDKLLTLLLIDWAIFALKRLRGARKHLPKFLVAMCVALALCLAVPYMRASAAGAAEAAGTRGVASAADYSSYLQTIYNNENGLPGGTANDIAQTADGSLWVGTYGGLYRYNGTNFEWIDDFESVKNVNCLFVDAENRLWIGTNDSGLSIYIKGEIANVLDEESGLPSNVVRSIAAGADGSFYYIGTDESLALVSLSSGLSVTDVVPEIVYAESITVGLHGAAAVVTEEGTLYLLNGTDILDQLTCPISAESFTCCTFTANGLLYVGTTGGSIAVYSTTGGALSYEKTIECSGLTNIKYLRESSSGQIVICADSGAGCLNSKDEFSIINTNSFNSSIDHMIFDYQGNLWFTSSRLGLLKLNPSAFTEIYSKIWLDESVVNAIVKWNGDFYFGTDNGLDMADSSITATVENDLTRSLEGVRIRSLLVDSRNRLWICTSSLGVLCVSSDGSITAYDSSNGALGSKARSALELSDGTMVLAGDSGITYVKNGEVTRTISSADGLENPRVLCLYEMSDGTLLAGTNGGGIAVIQRGQIVNTLHKSDGLSSQIIMRLVADPEGEGIYIITGSGLCFMDSTGAIRALTNFPYFNNYDVICGENNTLFVTCSAGIYVVDRDELLSGGELNYTLLNAKRGLRSSLTANSWNYVDANGNLYLAADSGVTMVNMTSYNVTLSEYRMDVRSIQVDDELYTVEAGEAFFVPQGSTRVVLSPEVMNYSSSDPNVSYWLEGLDETPYVAPLSTLTDIVYTNLPSGNYTFRLAVLDDMGNAVSEVSYKLIKEAEI